MKCSKCGKKVEKKPEVVRWSLKKAKLCYSCWSIKRNAENP